MIIDIFEILFAGMCVGLASSVTVGPVAVLCIQRTLSKGMLSGLMSGFGVAFADAILAILAFTVFALLKSYIDQYNTIIQICAGVFVIIVGICIFFKNPVPQIRKNRAGKTHLWQDFASMFGFTLANFVVIIPYILAFFAMFNVNLSANNSAEDEELTPKTTLAVDSVEQSDNVEMLDMGDGAGSAGVAMPTVTRIASVDNASDEALSDEAKAEDEGAVEPTAEPKSMDNKKEGRNGAVGGFIYNSLIILGFLLGAMLWWLSITAILNLFRKGFRPRHMLTINHIAGVVIGVLGIYTLLSVLIK